MERVMAPLVQHRHPTYFADKIQPGLSEVEALRVRDNDGDDDSDGDGGYHGHHHDDGSSNDVQDAYMGDQDEVATSISSPTSTSIPTVTSASASLAKGGAIGSLPTYTSSPDREGVDGSTAMTQMLSFSSLIPTAMPTSTVLPALQDNDNSQGEIGGGDNDGNGNWNGNNDGNHHKSGKNDLSPTAEKLLIAAGAIGAAILICATVYFIMRLFKKDPGASLKRYKQGMSRIWRKPKPEDSQENQPEGFSFYSEEKRVPTQRRLDAFFSPGGRSEVAVPASTATIERADSQRKALVHEALVKNPPPIELMPTSSVPEEYPPPPFYTPHAPVNQPVYHPAPANQATYATYNTNQRMSELSSLSSGFGDAKIDVPESGPSNVRAHRKSIATRASKRASGLGFISRFSWTSTSQTPQGAKEGVNRDTMYTTESEESVPRFRSIYSWVNQQSSRVRRQEDSDRELENMPDIPPTAKGKSPNHKRLSSETDPAFRYHPGDELHLKRGSRVPSEILDKALGR